MASRGASACRVVGGAPQPPSVFFPSLQEEEDEEHGTGRIPRALPYLTSPSYVSSSVLTLNSNPSLTSFADEGHTLGFLEEVAGPAYGASITDLVN
jgi:hypothetical protein